MSRKFLKTLVACAAAALAQAATAQIVIVSSQKSPVTALSREQAEQLYLGRTRSLSRGQPVTLVDLPAGVTRDRFYAALTGKNPSQVRAYWSRQVFTGRALPPREAPSTAEAHRWIAENPDMIGYLPEEALNPSGAQLRVLLRLP